MSLGKQGPVDAAAFHWCHCCYGGLALVSFNL